MLEPLPSSPTTRDDFLPPAGNQMTDGQTSWQQRVIEERDRKNLTDLHVRILLFARSEIEAGNDQMSHGEIAAALRVGVRTVGDAYRRAALLGLLNWETQYRDWHGVRRQTANLYRLNHETRQCNPIGVRRQAANQYQGATAPKSPQPEMPKHELAQMSYGEYLNTSEWQDKRKLALRRALYRCQLCNVSGNDGGAVLQVHHRTYENFGKELPSDLIVLCKSCHARHHRVYARQG